jgi:hypothetical protein
VGFSLGHGSRCSVLDSSFVSGTKQCRNETEDIESSTENDKTETNDDPVTQAAPPPTVPFSDGTYDVERAFDLYLIPRHKPKMG